MAKFDRYTIGEWLWGPNSGATAVNALEINDDGSINVTASVGPPPAKTLVQTVINFSASGNNTVVSGVAAKAVKVYRLILTVAGATLLTIKSGTGTSLTGPLDLLAGGSITLDLSGNPWYTTAAGQDFVINSTNAVQVSGSVDTVTE